jgi:hypothetical protein
MPPISGFVIFQFYGFNIEIYVLDIALYATSQLPSSTLLREQGKLVPQTNTRNDK